MGRFGAAAGARTRAEPVSLRKRPAPGSVHEGEGGGGQGDGAGGADGAAAAAAAADLSAVKKHRAKHKPKVDTGYVPNKVTAPRSGKAKQQPGRRPQVLPKWTEAKRNLSENPDWNLSWESFSQQIERWWMADQKGMIQDVGQGGGQLVLGPVWLRRPHHGTTGNRNWFSITRCARPAPPPRWRARDSRHAVCRCLQAPKSPAARPIPRCGGTAKGRSGSMPKVCVSPAPSPAPPPRPLPRPTLLLCAGQKAELAPKRADAASGGKREEQSPNRRSQRVALKVESEEARECSLRSQSRRTVCFKCVALYSPLGAAVNGLPGRAAAMRHSSRSSRDARAHCPMGSSTTRHSFRFSFFSSSNTKAGHWLGTATRATDRRTACARAPPPGASACC
eukprot:COSAG03_NODE_2853_length_2404_cov_6.943167_3_plen_392_part_00